MSECLQAVILRNLAPCEMFGKLIVVLREDHRRRTVAMGYTMGEVKSLLKRKYRQDFRDDDIQKVVDHLTTMNVLEVVSTKDARSVHIDLSPFGIEWSDVILEAASVGDKRFIPYVRVKRLEVKTW